MNKASKVLLGIFTILPMILVLFYMIMFMSFFFNMAAHEIYHDEIAPNRLPEFLQSFFPLFIMIFVAVMAGVVLMIYYIVHISKNQNFDSTQRLLWILIIIFTNTIGQVAYFILEIWPDKKTNQNSTP